MPNVIIVVGLYKSGTSLATVLIHNMGYGHLDDLYEDYVDGVNTKYLTYESSRVNMLNERIIRRMYGGSIACLPSWWRFHVANRIPKLWNMFAKDIVNLCSSKLAQNLALKDPRFCITLPWWIHALKCHVNIKIVWVFRDVTRTVSSWLNDSWCRSALLLDSYERTLRLASEYESCLMLQYQLFSLTFPSFVFNLESTRSSPNECIKRLADFIGFEGKIDPMLATVY